MEIKIEDKDGFSIMYVDGSLEGTNYEQMQMAFEGCLSDNKIRLIVDIEGMDYINSTAIATLCNFSQEFDANDGKFVISCPTASVMKLLTITGIERLVPIFKTLDEAIDAVK